MKKLISLFKRVCSITCSLRQTANEPQNGKDSAQLQTVVIASTGSDADIWRYIAFYRKLKRRS